MEAWFIVYIVNTCIYSVQFPYGIVNCIHVCTAIPKSGKDSFDNTTYDVQPQPVYTRRRTIYTI